MRLINIVKLNALLLPAVAAIGCQKSYEPIDFVEDVAWYTSETIKQDDVYKIAADSVIYFMDMSQGFTSHEWILEDGSYFMADNFDTSLHPYIDQIDESKGKISTDKMVNVLFRELGKEMDDEGNPITTTKVTLRNVFAGKTIETVKVLDPETNEETGETEERVQIVTSNTEEPIVAVKEGDEYVFTKEFVIDVFGKLNPSVLLTKVTSDGEESDIAELEEGYDESQEIDAIELIAGDAVRFTDLLGGDRPDSRIWSVGKETFTAETLDYVFSIPGEYDEFSFKSARALPKESITKTIPLKVTVKPSDADFEISDSRIFINDSKPNVIIVSAKNGAFATVPNVPDDFTVTVKDAEGIEVSGISVVAVRQSSSNPAALEVELSDKLYYRDEVVLSYEASTDTDEQIIAVDFDRVLKSFTEYTAVNNLTGKNVLPQATKAALGFDLPYEGNYWTQTAWYNTLFKLSSDQVKDGTGSLKIDTNEVPISDPNSFIMPKVNKFPFPARCGKYIVRCSIFVEKMIEAEDGGVIVFNDRNLVQLKGSDGNPRIFALPKEKEYEGQWVTQEIVVLFNEKNVIKGEAQIARFDFFKSIPEGTILYLDSIEVIELRETPEAPVAD